MHPFSIFFQSKMCCTNCGKKNQECDCRRSRSRGKHKKLSADTVKVGDIPVDAFFSRLDSRIEAWVKDVQEEVQKVQKRV